jgi:hypothetical protein
MHYNLRNLQAMLDSGDIDKTTWKMHFPDVPDTMVPTCADCLNLKEGICSGGANPVECFLYGTMSKSDGILLKELNAKNRF